MAVRGVIDTLVCAATVTAIVHGKMRSFIFYYSPNSNYRQTSNISRTLLGNKLVDYSDVVGASPVGTAPTASSFST